ncbi:MAG: hypothetical protein ACK4GO_15040 [Gemmobacter sp.]
MTETTPAPPPREPLALRLIHSIPLIGSVARDIGRDSSNVFYALVILLTCVVVAVRIWGLVALSMAALALVPVVFVLLILITRG